MRFLLDAQLPRRLKYLFLNAGWDTVHTLDLPLQNATTDADLLGFARLENRVVVTKDADFVDTHLLRGEPEKLLLVSTGNISNVALDALFALHLEQLIQSLTGSNWVELSPEAVIVHD